MVRTDKHKGQTSEQEAQGEGGLVEHIYDNVQPKLQHSRVGDHQRVEQLKCVVKNTDTLASIESISAYMYRWKSIVGDAVLGVGGGRRGVRRDGRDGR